MFGFGYYDYRNLEAVQQTNYRWIPSQVCPASSTGWVGEGELYQAPNLRYRWGIWRFLTIFQIGPVSPLRLVAPRAF